MRLLAFALFSVAVSACSADPEGVADTPRGATPSTGGASAQGGGGLSGVGAAWGAGGAFAAGAGGTGATGSESGGSAGTAPVPFDAGTADDGSAEPEDGGWSCPTGAVCFEAKGLVHAPVPGNEVKRLTYAIPAGQYRRIELDLDFLHGGWSPDPDGVRYQVFWLAHDAKNFDCYGFLAFVRPNTVMLRHGIGQVQGEKAKLSINTQLPIGELYHAHYSYDVQTMKLDLSVTRGSTQVAKTADVPNTTQIVFKAGQTLDIDFGFPGYANPAEPASFGWEFRNVRLVVVK